MDPFKQKINEVISKTEKIICKLEIKIKDLVNLVSNNYHYQREEIEKVAEYLVKINGYDCGVAVISFIKRIQANYQGNMKNIDLGEFDFVKEREELRSSYFNS
ncbi:MAG: hypothetical protein mread185_000164 [Mycoplasmataceae bacterium]|nr:MAG: hypothetical protein mread185_000164 [Mycoplasmataceae bacterium]